MFFDDAEGIAQFQVVVNEEEQYSLWPMDHEPPPGWAVTGKSGAKQECLEYLEAVWTDLRPLSLRQQMDATAPRLRELQNEAVHAGPSNECDDHPTLVQCLATGRHRIEACLRPEKTASRLKTAIQQGYVHIRFSDTRGGTELGLTLDERNCDLREADFDTGSGRLRLVGGLILDGARVRCIAELDLATLAGMGNLEVVERPPSDDFQQA